MKNNFGNQDHESGSSGRRIRMMSEIAPLGGLLGVVLVAVLLIGAASCSVEPQVGGTVTPSLNLKGLASDVNEVVVTVTGPGINQQETFSPSTNKIVIPLPEAEDVRFDVEAQKKNVGDGPVYSYGFARHSDLTRGESLNLDFPMGPYESKILVPDPYYDNRLVQLDNLDILEPTGWNEYQWDGFQPNDVVLDNQGRLWICESSGDLSRLNSINDTSLIPELDMSYISSIDFDRLNNYLYFVANYESLFFGRIPVSSASIGTFEDLTSKLNNAIAGSVITGVHENGIAVDDEGNVYLTGETDLGESMAIFKYNPSTNKVVSYYKNDSILSFSQYSNDLLFKNNYIYYTNANGPNGNIIMKFTKELQLVGGFGTIKENPPFNKSEFFGPSRFLATTNRKIYVIDEKPYDTWDANRIVGFSDIDGSGWESYMPQDSSGDLFGFYYS